MRSATFLWVWVLAACGDGPAHAGDAGDHDTGSRPPDGGRVDAGVLPPDAGARLDAGLVRRDDFTEAAGTVPNPDRGLYAWDWDESVQLVLVKPHLGEWCDGTPLPSSFFDELGGRLAGHAAAGRRVILRFVYADDEVLNPCMRADAMSVDVIEAHLVQLAPLLAEHANVIAFVEAGLLGMWGEWNSEHAPPGTSLWTDIDVRRRVLAALLDAVPPGRPVLVRRPRFRQELETVLTADALARVGHHNDCLFASVDDYGTYDGDMTVEEWKTYLETVTLTAPTGGETCLDDPTYTACDNALPELERLRYTYVHKNYQRAVIDRWRAEGCFDEIDRRLGYRVVLRAVEAPPAAAPGATFPVVIEIENVGFAPPYVTRRLRAVLRDASGATTLETRALEGADTRTWLAGATVRATLEVTIPETQPAGDYTLHLLLLDDHSDALPHAMLFANTAPVADPTTRENQLTPLTLR